jgi:DNA-binding transcriptional LysR family regulator
MTYINSTFQLAASYTIGSYILPGKQIDEMTNNINSHIKVNINSCHNIIDGIKDGSYDLGLIENPVFDKELIYHEWIENELVFCSKTKLPEAINEAQLKNYKLICREESSATRLLVGNFFKKLGISHESFKSLREINNTTAALQSVKWSKVSASNPTLTIISKLAIEEEIEREELFVSRFKDYKMQHNYHIVYAKENLNNPIIAQLIQKLNATKIL